MVRLAHHNKKRGFTLLELLLVIAIIASLAGIILMALNPAQRLQEANEVKSLTNAKDFEKALNAYVLDNDGQYPTALQALFTAGQERVSICKTGQTCGGVDLTAELITGGYVSSFPTHPTYSTTTDTGFDIVYNSTNNGITVTEVPWWLAGGISEANAVAVYQPVRAVDLALSYINLANPGTYNAAAVVAPTFSSTNGWSFNGSQYLSTGITVPVGAGIWSAIVKFTNSTGTNYRPLIGSPVGGFMLSSSYATGRAYSNGGTALYTTFGNYPSAVVALAGKSAYIDGISEGTIPAGNIGAGVTLWISRDQNWYFAANMQSVAIYNITLTTTQVAAVTNAMNTL